MPPYYKEGDEIKSNAVVVRDFGPAAVALERLKGSTTARDRFEVLQALVEYWNGPIAKSDGYSEAELAGLDLPDVLRWWYQWAGKRTDILSGQNYLYSGQHSYRGLDQLSVDDDGLLTFYIENQGCNFWATPTRGEDPAIYMQENGISSSWQMEQVRMSEHLIIACLFEAPMNTPYGAMTSVLPADTLKKIEQVVWPVAVPPWLWFSCRVFCANGIVMSALSVDDDTYTVWLGAHTADPLQFLKPFINGDWDYVAI